MGDEKDGSKVVETMELEQALFTSTRSQNLSGYHLVTRSPGIDEATAQALCRWSPSHDSLLSRHCNASSLNFFPLENDRFAISRTVLGGPEYSGRGGLQSVTMILVAKQKQLAGYANDPIALAKTALSEGYLSFVRNAQFQERITLPDRCLVLPVTEKSTVGKGSYVGEAISKLSHSKSIALIDAPRIRQAIQVILHQLPVERRLEMSFTTGLKPSAQRPFRIHHVTRPTIDIRAYFSRQSTGMISVTRQAVPAS